MDSSLTLKPNCQASVTPWEMELGKRLVLCKGHPPAKGNATGQALGHFKHWILLNTAQQGMLTLTSA